MNIKSLEELYDLVMPALKIKASEYNNQKNEKEIFDYLATTIWKYSHNLSLNEVVNDILKLNVYEMEDINYDK